MPYWAPLSDELDPAQRQLITELRALKDAHQLTYQQMGRLTHYSHASWERWLNGKRLVTREALAALLAATGHDEKLLRLHRIAVDPGHATAGQAAEAADAKELPDSTTTSSEAAAAVPVGIAQLPPGVAGFAGRDDQLRALKETLTTADGPGGQVRIAVITGGGGLGKTALAVRTAHQLADGFPDGQFFADLAGTDLAPRDPHQVLSGWLRALGQDIDPRGDLDELAARWRSALNGRRALVLLDNAKDAGQVLPLLPGSQTCAVLVTSRDWLAGIPGSRPTALRPLTDAEALDLLAARIGTARLAREPDAASEVVRLCGGIPLAVQIAAARLTARPAWPVDALGARLRDERRRLDELKVADLAVRAVFHLSYTSLPKPQEDEAIDPRRAFRFLGLAPKEVSLPAAAALLGQPEERTETALELLVDSHLLESPAPGRYRLHDLLRLYAGEQVAQQESEADRQTAVRRMAAWYLAGLAAADRLLYPGIRRPELPAPDPHHPPVVLADATAAFTWCDQEHLALVSTAQLAARHSAHDIAWLLAVFSGSCFRQRAWYAEWLAISDIGLDAARLLGDRTAQAFLLNGRGTLMILAGRFDEAEQCLTAVLRIRREIGDAIGELSALANIGSMYAHQQRWEDAKAHQLKALAMSRALGRRPSESRALNNLGECASALGDYAEAIDHLRAALAIDRETGDRDGEAVALINMAEAHLHHQRPAEGLPLLEQALPIAREIGNRYAEATALADLGRIKAMDGIPDEARAHLSQGRDLWHELGYHETAREVTAEIEALEATTG